MKRELTDVGKWFNRKKAALGLKDFNRQAESIGLTPSTITRYSYGDREMSLKTIDKIVKAFDLTPEGKREFYVATLSPQDMQKALLIDNNDTSLVDIALIAKFGELP